VTVAAADVNSSTATVRGTVNPNASRTEVHFEWGTAPDSLMNTTSRQTIGEGGDAVAIMAPLTGLTPETTYYFRVRADNPEQLEPQRGTVLSFVTAPFDSDRDGLPDDWEKEHWGTIAGHDARGDSDGDGLQELVEYAFNSNPRLPDLAALPRAVNEGGFLTITFQKRAGVSYTVETADSPHTADWSTSGTTLLINTATELKVRDNVAIGSVSSRFLRIRLEASNL